MKILLLFLSVILINSACKNEVSEKSLIANKPLYRDTIYDGAADPTVIYNREENNWFMFYTNRRANMADQLPGVSWVHGTPIDIAVSSDCGATWKYKTRARFNHGLDTLTLWAPEVMYNQGLYHMYLTVVPGVFTDWGHPRKIAHLTSHNLTDWEFQSYLQLASEKVIDACVYKVNDSTWRMWYNNEADHKSIYFADSKNLYQWKDKGLITHNASRPGEGPNVFNYRNKYYMIVDEWSGLGVYSSIDAINWKRQENRILDVPGTGREDKVIGQHADVLINNDSLYIFYFTHPEKNSITANAVGHARTLVQVAQLKEDNSSITCDRNKPVYIKLKKPE